ncbi:POTRA domain-containing protein, partial [Achromobacter xylosoxidans]
METGNFNKKQVHTVFMRRRLRQRRLPSLALSISFVAIFAILPPAAAQLSPAEAAARASDIQRRQEQELDAQRARAAERPDVLSAPAAPAAADGVLVLPTESPCFTVAKVAWDGPAPSATMRRASEGVLGRCVGGRGLQALQAHLMARLIDRGLITARVLVPEQSLAGGT